MYGLILIYALTAVASLAGLRYPVLAFYVYVGYSVLRPQFIWGWAGDLSNISFVVALSMLIGWVLKGFGSWRFGPGRSIVFALLIHAAWSALSALQAVSTPPATVALTALLKIVLAFLVGVTLLTTEREVRTLLWVIVAAQAYVGYELNMSYLAGNNVAQSQGFGGMDNNSIGIGLVATLGAAVGLLLSATTWRERTAALGAGLLIVHTVLLTFSRGAMLGLVAAGATAALIMPKRPRYIVAVAAGLAITLRLTGPELAARFESTFVETEQLDASSESRLELWRDCFAVAIAEPFFGVGPMNWPVIAENYGWPRGKEAHSVWMQTLAELGFTGVMALIAFYILTIVKLWSHLRRRRLIGLTTGMTLGFGIIISLAGYAVSAQFVSLLGLETPFYLVAAAVVLLKGVAEAVPRVNQADSTQRRIVTVPA